MISNLTVGTLLFKKMVFQHHVTTVVKVKIVKLCWTKA